jgi:RecJ-like exonuclease
MTCPTCAGTGVIHKGMTTEETCPTCSGALVIQCTTCTGVGMSPEVECPICHGNPNTTVYRQPSPEVRKLSITGVQYDSQKKAYRVRTSTLVRSDEGISVFLRNDRLYFIPIQSYNAERRITTNR